MSGRLCYVSVDPQDGRSGARLLCLYYLSISVSLYKMGLWHFGTFSMHKTQTGRKNNMRREEEGRRGRMEEGPGGGGRLEQALFSGGGHAA